MLDVQCPMLSTRGNAEMNARNDEPACRQAGAKNARDTVRPLPLAFMAFLALSICHFSSGIPGICHSWH
jgi:hypothetical protein